MRRSHDEDKRELARRIEQVFPRWVVLYGAYSRQFWAFPRFRVPRGTVAHAASPDEVAGMMRAIQRSATEAAR